MIVNEPYLHPYRQDDFLYKAFGNTYEYVKIIAESAREVTDGRFKLIVNDTDNHSRRGLTYNLTMNIVKISNADVVGVEGHLGDWVKFYPQSEVESTLSSFGRPVYITEFDVSQKGMRGDKNFIQAQESQRFLRAALNSGVVEKIIFWGLTENSSWLEKALNQPEANPTPFIDPKTPKPLYYAILQVFLSN